MRRFVLLAERADYLGEVGLDGSREGRDSLPAQRRVFDQVLGVPGIATKVLTVHSRGAEGETIARLAEAGASAILHWYSGALKHADAALDAGMYFSVNAAMLRSQKGARLLRVLPRERVLTETDGPYVRTGGRPVGPESIPQLVADLAGHWGADAEQVRAQIWSNMATLFAHRGDAPTTRSARVGATRSGTISLTV
jgi:TatD DNase family protein